MKTHEYLVLRPECVNIQKRLWVAFQDEERIDRPVRTLIDAAISGLGRLDVIARLAAPRGASKRTFAAEFRASVVGSRIFDVVSLDSRWTGDRLLVCDWSRGLSVALPPGSLAWNGPETPRANGTPQNGEKRHRAGGAHRATEDPLVSCPNRSLYVQAQVLRGILGTNRTGNLVLGGSVDRVLFGDLVFRHRSVTVLPPTWPEQRRVWQADVGVLQDTGEWLENLFYAIRHARDEDPVGLSPRAGTTVAGQEVRCLVDSRHVLCWTRAQRRELVRFYSRTERNTTLIAGEGGAPTLDATELQGLAWKTVLRSFRKGRR